LERVLHIRLTALGVACPDGDEPMRGHGRPPSDRWGGSSSKKGLTASPANPPFQGGGGPANRLDYGCRALSKAAAAYGSFERGKTGSLRGCPGARFRTPCFDHGRHARRLLPSPRRHLSRRPLGGASRLAARSD